MAFVPYSKTIADGQSSNKPLSSDSTASLQPKEPSAPNMYFRAPQLSPVSNLVRHAARSLNVASPTELDASPQSPIIPHFTNRPPSVNSCSSSRSLYSSSFRPLNVDHGTSPSSASQSPSPDFRMLSHDSSSTLFSVHRSPSISISDNRRSQTPSQNFMESSISDEDEEMKQQNTLSPQLHARSSSSFARFLCPDSPNPHNPHEGFQSLAIRRSASQNFGHFERRSSSMSINDESKTPSLKQTRKMKEVIKANRHCPYEHNRSVTPLVDGSSSNTTPILYHQCQLPLMAASKIHGPQTISAATVADLVRGKYNDRYDKIIIIDCRFKYEYDGGHVTGAVHMESPAQFEQLLFSAAGLKSDNPDVKAATMDDLIERGKRIAIVLHCEFSEQRAPAIWLHIRGSDRKLLCYDRFPKVFYPELYLMAGGYKGFFQEHSELCTPCAYTPMDSDIFREQETAAKKQRRQWYPKQ